MAEREHLTNGRCFAFGTGLCLVATAIGTQVSSWQHWIAIGAFYGSGGVLMGSSSLLILKSFLSQRSKDSSQASLTKAQESVPGIPTISALLGQNPDVTFDTRLFFARAHYSPVTAEVEKNIRSIAQQSSPENLAAFYARFIGVGLPAFLYEQAWLLIFGSQLRAMLEMNSRGMVPINDLRKHYDKAVTEFPQTYVDYAFEQWLAFLTARLLVVTYPSEMVELTFFGQDFLKYLAHTGRAAHKPVN